MEFTSGGPKSLMAGYSIKKNEDSKEELEARRGKVGDPEVLNP